MRVVYSQRQRERPIVEDRAMEPEIDRLLSDYEAGKVTRRQLIRNVAAAALAAVQSASAQPAASLPPPRDPAPWKTVWLDHISYSVSDYRRSTAFYRDLLGWQVKTDNGWNQCSLAIGNVGGIIIRNNRRAAGQRRPIGVIDHVAWGIEPWDTDAVRSELQRRGLAPRPDMRGDGFKSFHVTDPDGWNLQISNQRDTREL